MMMVPRFARSVGRSVGRYLLFMIPFTIPIPYIKCFIRSGRFLSCLLLTYLLGTYIQAESSINNLENNNRSSFYSVGRSVFINQSQSQTQSQSLSQFHTLNVSFVPGD